MTDESESTEDGPPHLADVAAARALVYSVMGRLLVTPTEERLSTVRDALPSLLVALAVAPELAAFGASQPLVARLEDPRAFARSIDDYTVLFVSGQHPGCDLTLSARLAPDAGAAVVRAASASLRRAGLAPQSSSTTPSDHAATLLDLLAHCCQQEGSAWEDGDVARAGSWMRQESSALTEHLVPWLPGVADRVARAAPASLYTVVVDTAARVCRHDADFLAALCESVEGAE